MSDDILDSLFHGCALQAYLEVCAATKQFPPDSEATRLLAYRLYEEALAEKNRNKPANRAGSPPHEAGQGCGVQRGAGAVAQQRARLP